MDQTISPLLPAGLVTLQDWAERIGRSPRTVINHWRPRPGFPAPVGRLPRPVHGGRGRLLYEERALDAWREAQPDLWLPHRVELAREAFDPEARVTLGWFATHVARVARKTVTQYRDTVGFPTRGVDGKYRAADLARFWSARPGKRGASKHRR